MVVTALRTEDLVRTAIFKRWVADAILEKALHFPFQTMGNASPKMMQAHVAVLSDSLSFGPVVISI